MINQLNDLDVFNSFSKESIWERTHRFIVPSRGHADFLSYQVTKNSGVCIGFSFDFPATFLWSMVGYFDGRVDEKIIKKNQSERLYKLWCELANHHEHDFAPSETFTDVHRYRWALQLLNIWERYDRYRPDWLAIWKKGELFSSNPDEIWQSSLWNKVVSNDLLSSEILSSWIQHLYSTNVYPLPDHAPKSITLFCLSTLPPLYLSAYYALSLWMDVSVWVINPCEHYWGDICHKGDMTPSSIGSSIETGNFLLASWGRARCELVEWLLKNDLPVEENFSDITPDTTLHSMQSDILTWSNKGNWLPDDSLQIHRCHSFVDELHVLHRFLQKLFHEDRSLCPADVLVWIPDLASNAAWVDAVFSNAQYSIPYTITGLPSTEIVDMYVAITQWLSVINSRYEYSVVLSWLRLPVVRLAFNIEQNEWQELENIIYNLGVRWGLDSSHRADWAVDEHRHTWMFALERLFRSFCCGESEELGISFSTEQMEVLSLLVDLLKDWPDRLRRKHRIVTWVAWIKDSITKWCPARKNDIFEEISVQWNQVLSSFYEGSELVEFQLIVEMLKDTFRDPLRGGVPSGSVTFTCYGSLSGLPYKFLACLGLEEGVFPRSVTKCRYDLMSLFPRPGDEHCTRDDRAAFLDALMHLDYLHLSYVAWDQTTNSLRVPSSLIEDIMRYLSDKMPFCNSLSSSDEVEKYFVHEHMPYQVCFSASADEASCNVPCSGSDSLDYIVSSSLEDISLDKVVSILNHPVRYFMTKIANIRASNMYYPRNDYEPFYLNFSSKKKWIMSCLTSDVSFLDAKQSIDFPYGIYGEREWGLLCQSVAAVRQYLSASGVSHIDLGEESYEIESGCYGSVITNRKRMIKILPCLSICDYLRFWIEHVFYCIASSPKYPSLLVAPDDAIKLEVIEKSSASCIWEDIISICMQSQKEPIPFFPRTSYEYTTKEKDLASAYRIWRGSEWHHGEQDDPYYHLLYDFGRIDALCNPNFEYYANLVWSSYFKMLV